MPNPEHLKILHQGVAAWNRWRENNPGIRLNLEEAYLSGTNLAGANLCKASLGGADLSGSDLSFVDFAEADLRGIWGPFGQNYIIRLKI